MWIRRFMQQGTRKEVAINMDLVEAIWPNNSAGGTVIQLHGWENGASNNWTVTDEYSEIVKSLQAEQMRGRNG